MILDIKPSSNGQSRAILSKLRQMNCCLKMSDRWLNKLNCHKFVSICSTIIWRVKHKECDRTWFFHRVSSYFFNVNLSVVWNLSSISLTTGSHMQSVVQFACSKQFLRRNPPNIFKRICFNVMTCNRCFSFFALAETVHSHPACSVLTAKAEARTSSDWCVVTISSRFALLV